MARLIVETDAMGVSTVVFVDSRGVVYGYREFGSRDAAVVFACSMSAAGCGEVVLA